MNYTEIAAQVEGELNRPDKTLYTQRWIEDTYRDFMSREKFSWLFNTSTRYTVANQYRYALPTDFYSLMDLVFINGTTDSWRLKLYTAVEFDTLHPNVLEDTVDKPEDCCITTGLDSSYVPFSELLVWPAPDVSTYTFTLRYEVVSPALSGVLVPIIPERYHAALVFGALSRGFANLREYEAAAYWELKYEKIVTNAIVDDKKQPPRNQIMLPFQGAQVIYPPSYWKKYDVGRVF